jgi:hypothetical protein
MKKFNLLCIILLCWILLAWCGKKELSEEQKQEIVQQAFKEAFSDIGSNTEKKIEKKEIVIPYWDSIALDKWDDEIISLSITDVGVSGEFQDKNWWETYTPKNKFLVVTLMWENIWKVPWFIYIWDTFKVRNSEWYVYSLGDAIQATSIDKEYDSSLNTCISCEFNPWEKAIEYAIFDVPERSDYQLVYDDYGYDDIYVFDLQ